MVRILPEGKLARRVGKVVLDFHLPLGDWLYPLPGLPIWAVMGLSFTKYNVAKPPQFIGLQNYIDLFNDKIFYKSLTVSAMPYIARCAARAHLCARSGNAAQPEGALLGGFSHAYYVPALVGGSVAVAFLFQLMLNPTFGVVNYFIARLLGQVG